MIEKGLIPYISYPGICNRCGELWPEMFMLPDEEWNKYISPNGKRFLCRECFDCIKQWIDEEQNQIPYEPDDTCYESDLGIVMDRKSMEHMEGILKNGEKVKTAYESCDYRKKNPRTLWLWEGLWIIISYTQNKGKYWELDVSCREEALEFLYKDIIKRDV